MSYFTDFTEFKRLEAKVGALHRARNTQNTERERFLDTTPPRLLAPSSDNDDLFYIGGHWIPVNAMEGHILTQGISGVGKTLQLKPQIASAIKSIHRGTDRRVFIADAKKDMLPFVAKLTQEKGIPYSISTS